MSKTNPRYLTKETAVPHPRKRYRIPLWVYWLQAKYKYLTAICGFVGASTIALSFLRHAQGWEVGLILCWVAFSIGLLWWGIWHIRNHNPLWYDLEEINVRVVFPVGAQDAFIPPRILREKLINYANLWRDKKDKVKAGTLKDPNGWMMRVADQPLIHLRTIFIEPEPVDAERPETPDRVAYGKAYPVRGEIFIWKERSQDWSVLEYEVGNVLASVAGMSDDELANEAQRRRMGVLYTSA